MIDILPLDVFGDSSIGKLRVIGPQGLPIHFLRFFFVSGTPLGLTRGHHAHRECHQLLYACAGSMEVVVEDGTRAETIVLTPDSGALLISPMVWSTQRPLTPDAVLFVGASTVYDEQEYIRDYNEFLSLAIGT